MYLGIFLLLAGGALITWLIRSRHDRTPRFLYDYESLAVPAGLGMVVFGIAFTVGAMTT